MSSSRQSLVDLQSKENWNNHQMYNVSLVIQTKFSEKEASLCVKGWGSFTYHVSNRHLPAAREILSIQNVCQLFQQLCSSDLI